MKKVAVFGNAGAGKSTLARRLAELTQLPLYVIDKMQFRDGADAVPHEEYLKAHADLLRQDAWIVDGFGNVATAWERFAEADTLVYIDLPLVTHHWWVTKRLIKGLFATVSADGTIRIMEAELMRLAGAALDCPLPPLFDQLDPATLTA